MISNPFTPSFENLPKTIAIFPLTGAILLPNRQLHLNIFEPRYLNMTFDALGAERMIGMIQPDKSSVASPEDRVYKTGCAGRITAFSETDDGRLLIILTGVCRFAILEEIPTVRGYRRIIPNWQPFAGDLADEEEPDLDAPSFLQTLQAYFSLKNIQADLDSMKKMPVGNLIDLLAMNLPFEPEEKQALLESMTLSDRARIMMGLTEILASGQSGSQQTKH